MKGPTPRNLHRYAAKCLGLKAYLQQPGDGRSRPRLPAAVLLWALLIARLLRCASFAAVEALVRSPGRPALPVSRRFGDDALGYFTERVDPAATRNAARQAIRQAKRNKAFDMCRFIGLALDGTGAGRSRKKLCEFCRPYRNPQREIAGYHHRLVLISVVGTGLVLPFDIEPYGPSDSEYAAGQRLLRRAVGGLGKRFAQYVVVDGEFATAPFLHAASDLGLHVVLSYSRPLSNAFVPNVRTISSIMARTEWKFGMPTISTLGKNFVGRPYASFSTASTSQMAS